MNFDLDKFPHGDLDDEEKPRLSRQCSKILAMLQAGDCTNSELATVALSYTRRITDLRQHGFDVQIVESGTSGKRVYRLMPLGQLELPL